MKEVGVLMGVMVVKVMLTERWGFDESVPIFADTLGCDRKTFENVCHDFFGNEWWVAIH